MTVIRDFSIGSVTFEGMQSSNQLTVLGRSMVPPELLERLDDEVQVKIVDIRGSAIYAHLAHLPMEHAGETHEILCAVTHRFTRRRSHTWQVITLTRPSPLASQSSRQHFFPIQKVLTNSMPIIHLLELHD
ncbi:uncharacterized protein LOC111250188 isoform X2 [Varroa destructor]|uniref:Uncharacterized protein n=1 Tax=Varroa destructor TaxID=109461 RepID=A0A7M7K2R7_VARDE|nr:uncharacterized protein LOC111250188 isoform X2 [Varroa destructor]